MTAATGSSAPDLPSQVRAIVGLARAAAAGTDQAPAVDAIERRLDEPLRVAIAGRVKAGKSTLLNALVGERLAATDAGECTRIVTWYRHGLGYTVTADLRPEGRTDLVLPARGRRAAHRPGRPRRRRHRAHRGRLAVGQARGDDAHRHAGARLRRRAHVRTDDRVAARCRRRGPGRGRCGAVPDAPPPPWRCAVPRGVHGPLDRACVAGQCGRRAVAGRRDRRGPTRCARLGPVDRRPLRRRPSGPRARVGRPAGGRAAGRDRRDAAPGAVRLDPGAGRSRRARRGPTC